MHIVGALKGLAAPLQVYWLDVLIVLAGIAAVIWLWRKGRIDIIKRLIRVMVVRQRSMAAEPAGSSSRRFSPLSMRKCLLYCVY